MLSIGIVGLPNAGPTSALTEKGTSSSIFSAGLKGRRFAIIILKIY